MKNYIYYVFLSLLILGCEKKSNKLPNHSPINIFDSWPKTVQLQSTPVKSFGERLTFPVSINSVGDFLVFVEMVDTSIVKIFSLDDYSYLGSYGDKGQGPDEFVAITGIIQDERKDKPYLTFYDWGKKIILKYNIDNLIKANKVSPVKSFVLPPEIIQTHKALFSPKDSIILGFAGINKGKLFNYDRKSDSIETVTPFIPRIKYSSEKYKVGMLYRGSIALNPHKSKIAVVSRLFRQIEIYDYNLNMLNASRFGKNIDIVTREPNSRMEIETSSYSKLNYTDLDFNEESIFVYYENRTLDEMNKGICHSSEIHAYDWQSNPKIRYKLEDCPNFIAYDHKNNRFIGIFIFPQEQDDEKELIRYYQI